MKTPSASKGSTSHQKKRVERVSKQKHKRKETKQKKRKNETVKNVKDPNLPKKPATAFFYYMEDFRKIYQEQNPEVKGMREIGKACGIKWTEMPYEEKAPYFDIATQKRADYEKILQTYNRSKEADAPDAADKANSEINEEKYSGEEDCER